jgi:hypothetical protein
MNEVISARGEMTLEIWNKDGKLLERITDKNLIVNLGKQSLAALLGSADENKRVAYIGFGTSNAATSGTDTDLENVFPKALDGVSYSGTAVIFDYALELSENNGVTIREFGLYTLDETLFSRLVRNPINKTAEIRLTGSWKITF